MEQWRRNPEWVEVEPKVEASSPRGTFLVLDCRAVVALPPSTVFDLLCDPGNKRVFKSVKGIRDHRVLEESPERRVVELEMVTGWRFLVFSGEFGVHLRLTHDKQNMKVSFEMMRHGLMRHFVGEWSVEPLPVGPTLGNADVAADRTDRAGAAMACESITSFDDSPPDLDARLASQVRLVQQVQPAMNPPFPISQYLRHIAAKTIKESLQDIQVEAARIRFGLPEDVDMTKEAEKMKKVGNHAVVPLSQLS